MADGTLPHLVFTDEKKFDKPAKWPSLGFLVFQKEKDRQITLLVKKVYLTETKEYYATYFLYTGWNNCCKEESFAYATLTCGIIPLILVFKTLGAFARRDHHKTSPIIYYITSYSNNTASFEF